MTALFNFFFIINTNNNNYMFLSPLKHYFKNVLKEEKAMGGGSDPHLTPLYTYAPCPGTKWEGDDCVYVTVADARRVRQSPRYYYNTVVLHNNMKLVSRKKERKKHVPVPRKRMCWEVSRVGCTRHNNNIRTRTYIIYE